VLTDVSEEHISSIFKVEEKSEQETSVKAGACHLLSRWCFLRNVG
jgi:hypothetical protein